MNLIQDYLKLIRKMPLPVNLAWMLMHAGLGIMIIAMVEGRWLLMAIGSGVVLLAGASTFALKGEMAARFSTALLMTTIGAVAMMVIVLPISLVGILVLAIFDDFSWRGVLGVLSFLIVLIAFQMITSVARFASREPGEVPSPE